MLFEYFRGSYLKIEFSFFILRLAIRAEELSAADIWACINAETYSLFMGAVKMKGKEFPNSRFEKYIAKSLVNKSRAEIDRVFKNYL